MRAILSVLLLAGILLPHSATGADDAALIDQLVARSPWKGENIGERGLGSVTYDLSFSKDPAGRLAGVVSNYSIEAFASVANGPVKSPSVKNGVLTFQTRRGAYEVRPASGGRWSGTALSLDQTCGAKVTLTPATR